MHSDDLFTAPQVAKLCSTDLKTIHNWVNRGEISFFRTPGRHLRFRRQDILDFLKRFGYPVPEGFSPSRPKVVVIDASEENLTGIRRALSNDVDIDAYPDHMDALLAIGKDRPALVLVNGDGSPDMMHLVQRLAGSVDKLAIAVYGEGASLHKESRDAGAQEFIHEFDSAEIRRRVVSLLGVTA